MDEKTITIKTEQEDDFEYDFQSEMKLEMEHDFHSEGKLGLEYDFHSEVKLEMEYDPHSEVKLEMETELDLPIKSEVILKEEQEYHQPDCGPTPIVFPGIKEELYSQEDPPDDQGMCPFPKQGGVESGAGPHFLLTVEGNTRFSSNPGHPQPSPHLYQQPHQQPLQQTVQQHTGDPVQVESPGPQPNTLKQALKHLLQSLRYPITLEQQKLIVQLVKSDPRLVAAIIKQKLLYQNQPRLLVSTYENPSNPCLQQNPSQQEVQFNQQTSILSQPSEVLELHDNIEKHALQHLLWALKSTKKPEQIKLILQIVKRDPKLMAAFIKHWLENKQKQLPVQITQQLHRQPLHQEMQMTQQIHQQPLHQDMQITHQQPLHQEMQMTQQIHQQPLHQEMQITHQLHQQPLQQEMQMTQQIHQQPLHQEMQITQQIHQQPLHQGVQITQQLHQQPLHQEVQMTQQLHQQPLHQEVQIIQQLHQEVQITQQPEMGTTLDQSYEGVKSQGYSQEHFLQNLLHNLRSPNIPEQQQQLLEKLKSDSKRMASFIKQKQMTLNKQELRFSKSGRIYRYSPNSGILQNYPDLLHPSLQILQKQQPQQPDMGPVKPQDLQKQALQQLLEALNGPNTPEQQAMVLKIVKRHPRLMAAIIKRKLLNRKQLKQRISKCENTNE